MDPGLALINRNLWLSLDQWESLAQLVPQILNPTSTDDCFSLGMDSITLTSSFMGTRRDDNICSI
jgi:hypothetical protein